MSLRKFYKDVTIANGQSLSDVIDLGYDRLCWIGMPAAWTAASITFQGSHDGETWFDIHTSSGSELSLAVAASKAVLVSPVDFIGFRFIRIRSGTSAEPVAQAAARSFVLGVMP